MWTQTTAAVATPSLQPRAAKAAPRVPLTEAVRLFLKRSEAKGLSPRTVQFYRERLGVFLRWLEVQRLPAMEAQDVSPSAIREFLAHERKRTSPATAKHAYASLSAFYHFCEREEIVPANPMKQVEKPRTPARLVEPLTHEEARVMLAACGKGFLGARMKAMLLTLLDCGLRLSELCGLTLDDVSLDGQSLKVMGKGARERLVPFGEASKRALKEYLAHRGELSGERALFVGVYGAPMQPRRVHKALEDCGKLAGVKGVHPHKFRHTFAVMYLRNGGDAFSLQRALGHSSLEMTKRYCALADADLAEKHRLASPGDKFLAAVQPTNGRRRLR